MSISHELNITFFQERVASLTLHGFSGLQSVCLWLCGICRFYWVHKGPHVRKPIEIQGSFEERPLWNPVGSIRGFPCGSAGKESACNAGDLGSIPELGRSPGDGKGYLLQYSGLENSMDCIVHGVANSRTRLNDFHFQALSDQQKGSKKIC